MHRSQTRTASVEPSLRPSGLIEMLVALEVSSAAGVTRRCGGLP